MISLADYLTFNLLAFMLINGTDFLRWKYISASFRIQYFYKNGSLCSLNYYTVYTIRF